VLYTDDLSEATHIKTTILSFAILVTLAGAAFATPIPVTVIFDGNPADNPTGVQDPYYNYVTPYEVKITKDGDQTIQLVTCYDNQDAIAPHDPEVSLAYQELSITDVLSNGMFKSYSDALLGYESIAWLMKEYADYPDQAHEIGLQYAVWDVFGTVKVDPLDPNSLKYKNLAAYNAYTDYEADLAPHIGVSGDHFAGYDFSHAVFLEPTNGVVKSTTQPFVFWTTPGGGDTSSTPEPGTLAMIGGGLLCLLTSLGFKRFAGKNS
jgi:hypothetical protein